MGTRIVRTYRQTINAAPDVVFPLLCPVREAEWLEGWRCTMIYSASGLAEDGAVFTTSGDGEPDTVWIMTRYDREAGLVDFTRVTPGSRTCLLRLAVSAMDDGRSHVDISYAHTSLTPAGDAYLETWTNEAFLEAMVFWERSMNHYLKTGARLQRGTR
ncbi:MAG TPA: hypothetical protein VLT86_19740 [Vicinamibacterales bacterium]|nr:hypothetical protein [Vicinamibacterales bacterium]